MRPSHLIVLLSLALLATLIPLYTSSTGIGLAPDSYIYTATARSLLSGHGARIPNGPGVYIHSAHFPPLYAGLLALSSLGGADPLAAAGSLNALLFGATVCLAGLAVLKLTGGNLAAASLCALAVLASDELILIHTQVWSEPPFLPFALSGLLLLSIYLVDRKSWRLVGAATAFALAFLVRYAGVALVLAGVLSLLALPDRSALPARTLGGNGSGWRFGLTPGKLKRLALFLAISCAPVGLWMLYNRLAAGSLTNRELAYHPLTLRDLSQGANTIAGWFLPLETGEPVRSLLAPAIVLAGLALLGLAIRGALRQGRTLQAGSAAQTGSSMQASLLPFALFTLVYTAFLLVSLSFFDAQTSLDSRILSPVLVTGLILIASGLGRWLPRAPRGVWIPALLALAVLLAVHVYHGIEMARRLQAGELKGYGEAAWRSSKLIRQIDGLPADTLIYSNGHDVLYLLTGRPAIGIPRLRSPNSLRGNPHFDADLLAMRIALEEQNGVLVIFYDLQERRRYLPAEYDLNELLPLERVTRWVKEGAYYRIRR